MQRENILHHRFENGLTLVAQPMPWLASAAFSISVPAGCRYDAADKIGMANFVCEMVQRGSGELDSRNFIEQLQLLGVDYSSSASNHHTHFGGAMKATELHDTISIYADVLRRPHFPEDQLDDGRQVCFQEIMALDDDLTKQVMIDLRLRYYGDPDGRHGDGTIESVSSITLDEIRAFHQAYYQPDGMIIAIAGKIDWEQLKSHVEKLFGDWKANPQPAVTNTQPQRGVHHIPYESEQTHIAVAYPGLTYSDKDFYLNRAAIGVLSDGMSSRLFSEIREKRGLCYSIFASCHSTRDRGAVIAYSGTSAARAQETLDVLLEQLVDLKNGVRDDELQRLKVQMRSGLIMQQESCRSRASTIFGDWFHLGRVKTIEELNEVINGLTVDAINDYLQRNPPSDFDVVTLGSSPLELKHGISTASA
jgi:predicted Zn-dependent peptidase